MKGRASFERIPVSRYELLLRVASGGMATVYLGRLRGAAGFKRLVAIKRAHAHLLEDEAMRRLLANEAMVAAKIHHTNVVSVVDVEESEGELLLVMDYVEGPSLSQLVKAAGKLPERIAMRVILDACAGLQAAHELTDDDGRPLGIVHRDVSPQNILIGRDGISKLTDFGIAKAVHSSTDPATTTGVLKGKLRYMAPEYARDRVLDVRGDLFGMAVVLWELLAGQPLFRGADDTTTLSRLLELEVPDISALNPECAPIDKTLATALSRAPEDRFQTVAAFAAALENAARGSDLIGTHADVALFVKQVCGDLIARRRESLRQLEDGDPLVGTDSILAPAHEVGRDGARPADALAPAEASHVTLNASRIGFTAPAAEPRKSSTLVAVAVATVLIAGAALLVLGYRLALSRQAPPSWDSGAGAAGPPLSSPAPSMTRAPAPSAPSSAMPATEAPSSAPSGSKALRPAPAPVKRPSGPAVAPNPYRKGSGGH